MHISAQDVVLSFKKCCLGHSVLKADLTQPFLFIHYLRLPAPSNLLNVLVCCQVNKSFLFLFFFSPPPFHDAVSSSIFK